MLSMFHAGVPSGVAPKTRRREIPSLEPNDGRIRENLFSSFPVRPRDTRLHSTYDRTSRSRSESGSNDALDLALRERRSEGQRSTGRGHAAVGEHSSGTDAVHVEGCIPQPARAAGTRPPWR